MGCLFKDARTKAGLEIHHVAKVLKIKREYLLAIENNEDYIMPAQVYVNGYKKLYANYLGINLEDALSNKSDIKQANIKPSFLLKKKYRDKLLVPASTILVFIIIYWWQSLTSSPPISLIDDLTKGSEEYNSYNSDDNSTFRYREEYDLKNIESK